jgi:dienelactone hydrolase
MDRRYFIQSASLMAASAASVVAEVPPAQALAQGTSPEKQQADPSPTNSNLNAGAAPMTKRWDQQRWVLDNLIQANGVDWDQPRTGYWNAACGMEASADFAAIRRRVKKFADISLEFEAQACRREQRAIAAEQRRDVVTARENYFVAAVHWGAAQWPIQEANEQNRRYNQRKRECFGYSGGRIPAVVAIPGMDSFKEASVGLYGDSLLSRGFAVLAVDGPGQYESPLLGVYMTMKNWEDTGKSCMDWLQSRKEVDPERVAMTGRSFGSFGATIAVSNEPRYRAIAVSATCFEPGFHTIFQEASPTFKMRFMFMANIPDEAAFDEFRKTLTWVGYADKINIPYLCCAGQADELSPIANTERLFNALRGPRQLVIYQESRHSVGSGVPSAILGPSVSTLTSDWLGARFNGDSFPTEQWFVDSQGQITKTSI